MEIIKPAQLPSELLSLIQNGESVTVEFKKSATEITKDVYATVCAFPTAREAIFFLV